MIKYKYNLVKSKFSLCCYNYLQSKSKTLLYLIAGGGEGKTEEMGLGEVGRLAECMGLGGEGVGRGGGGWAGLALPNRALQLEALF